jgi:hypothetical protein
MHWPHKATELIEGATRQIGECYTSRLQNIAWELAEAHEGRGLRAPAL